MSENNTANITTLSLKAGFMFQVNGCDVTNVPQHVFFNMLRSTDRVAMIQVMKIPVAKVGCISSLVDTLLVRMPLRAHISSHFSEPTRLDFVHFERYQICPLTLSSKLEVSLSLLVFINYF